MPDLVKMLNSQLVVAEEKRVKFFILQDFWPAFQLFQFCGFFPIKKVIDDNANISLQPTKIWKSVIILSTWLLVLFLPQIGKLLGKKSHFITYVFIKDLKKYTMSYLNMYES